MPKMSEMRSASVVAVVGIAAAGLWVCSAAHAQSAAGASAGTASQSSEPDTNLNEIVVTALRRSERIQDVPIAINVVSEAQLNDSQVTSVRDLGQLVPGLKFSASVQAFPTIRGVYSEQSDPGNDPNVSIYVDGVYQANPIADNFDLVDIDHIEVLKGPQGTLFGRNATGGAIRIFTTDPSFTPTGLADVSYGRFNDVAVHTYYAGPVVGDVVAASLAVNYETSDGYNYNVVTQQRDLGVDNKSFRFKLLVKPNDIFSARIIVGYQDRFDANIEDWSALNGNSIGRLYGPGVQYPSQPNVFASNVPPFQHDTQQSLSAKLDFHLPVGTITSTTAYTDTWYDTDQDADMSSLDLLNYNITSRQHDFQQELIFSSDKMGMFQFVAGSFFYRSLGRYDPLILSGSFEPATLYGFMSQLTDAYAGFGELTFTPVDRLSFIAGLRYSHEKRDADGTYVITPVRPALPELGTTSFDATTPRGSVVYDLASDDNVYFTYSKGFKSGGYNISGLSTTPFKPEFLSAYEVGLKTSPSRLVSANLSAFYYDYTDQQVQAFVNGLNVTGNAASSHIYGADADIIVKASREFTVLPGFSYLHARYQNFPGAVYSVPTPPATPGGPPCLCGNETVTGNLSGYTLPDTPDFTGRIMVNYKHDLGFGTLDLSTTVFYTTRFYIEPSDRLYQGGYMTLAARAAVTPRDSHLSVYLYGKNLANKAYIVAGYPPATADAVVWSEPRTYGIGARFHF